MGTGFAKKKKQAKMMQEQFHAMQPMKDLEVVGVVANGLVSITMNGDGDVKKVKIKPECVDKEDVEDLEDLMLVAFNDAKEKVRKESSKSMPTMPGGIGGFQNFGM